MTLSDCRMHVSITPYQRRLVPDGITVVDTSAFDANLLTRCEWPPSHNNPRLPEGGRGGDVVFEQIQLVWEGNKLIYPISSDAQPLAERREDDMQIIYEASFLAQLDGQVAYVPLPSLPQSGINGHASIGSQFFYILIESPIAEIHAIRFTNNQAVIVDPFVKHSMPIPLANTFEFAVWHRAINGVLRQDADPAGVHPIIINLNKVDRLNPISARRIGPQSLVARGQPKVKHLSSHFSKELRALEEANAEEIRPYGQYIADFANHTEQVVLLPWPGADNSDGIAGLLEQDFLVTWRLPVGHENDPNPSNLELEFEGLSGSFVGEKGRPGVEYNNELGVYKADLLMARPDGSFFIQPSDHSAIFAMALALPNENNGNPEEETLRVFLFRNGATVHLNPRVYHSVPIPLASINTGILFREVISATNANLVINVKSETGHPIQFVQGI